jgi:hypothetical protein
VIEVVMNIVMTIVATVGATMFVCLAPTFEPASGNILCVTAPVLVAIIYLLVHALLLRALATRFRVPGIFNVLVAILPLASALGIAIAWWLGHMRPTGFQLSVGVAMFCAGIAEFWLAARIRGEAVRRSFGEGVEQV